MQASHLPLCPRTKSRVFVSCQKSGFQIHVFWHAQCADNWLHPCSLGTEEAPWGSYLVQKGGLASPNAITLLHIGGLLEK